MNLSIAPSRLALRVLLFLCVWTQFVACRTKPSHTDQRTGTPPAEAPVGSDPRLPGTYVAPPGAKALLDGNVARSNAAQMVINVKGSDLASYRYKFGQAENLMCAEAANYSGEIMAPTPITIDQSGLRDGNYLLCVIGGNSRHEWQDYAGATTAAWTIDRKGPAPVKVDSISLGLGANVVKFTWQEAEGESAASYDLAIAQPSLGCGQPFKKFHVQNQREYTVQEPIPGGRFIVCVTAYDDLGNVTVAENNGEIVLERPVDQRLVFYTGESAETKTLMYATRLGTKGSWKVTPVPLPVTGRYSGRAVLALAADGTATLAYQMIDQPDLSLPRLSLSIATASDDGRFSHKQLVANPLPGGAGFQTSMTLGLSADLNLISAGEDAMGPSLTFTRSNVASQTPATTVKLTDSQAARPITDSAIVSDDQGRLYLLFVRGETVVARLRSGDNWGAEQNISAGDCSQVFLGNLAVNAQGKAYAAYLCSHGEERHSACDLMLASRDEETWSVRKAATVDPSSACLPFNSGRPALAVDAQGQAHMLFRFTDQTHVGLWDIGYIATKSAGFRPQISFDEWASTTGFPQLTLDATDQVFAAYLTPSGLRFAASDAAAAGFVPETIAFDSEPALSGQILELSDLLIHGGHGRGFQRFGN